MSDLIAVDIQGLSKQFRGKGGVRVDALNNLTMQIGQGEIFGFLGPNGAGKSTTIKCLMGLIRPTTGSAAILGETVGAAVSRANVGYLPENPAFYDYLSGEEFLHFVGKTFLMPDDLLLRRTEEALRQLDLADSCKRPMRGYSKGMVQRIGLAQTLIHDPALYVLDEPMSGLDPIGRALVKDIILDLKKRGKTVFFSTHITDDVEKVCDRVGVIVQGKLVALDCIDNIVRKGVEGHLVQTRPGQGNHEVLTNFQIRRKTETFIEYFVSAAEIGSFMSLAAQNEVETIFIETKRKDLESFFLEIVNMKKD